MNSITFSETVNGSKNNPLTTEVIKTFQVNVGLRCNQQCSHCHLRAGPEREEIMSWETMGVIIQKAKEARVPIIDITGGAPEMNPDIRRFVRELKKNGHHIMLRTNLTALLEEGNRDLPAFYRDNRIELITSLPCYEKGEVDCVRGDGVFDRSIEALRMLNGLGYGIDPDLKLNLVFNPMADFLPPPQRALKEEYVHELGTHFGIVFSDLFTITNMPIGRFLDGLLKDGRYERYMDLLRSSFNPDTIPDLMCRSQINIGWDGTLYDCDFNQAIGLKTLPGFPQHIRELEPSSMPARTIAVGDHCFGCTAGAGSSCGGALLD